MANKSDGQSQKQKLIERAYSDGWYHQPPQCDSEEYLKQYRKGWNEKTCSQDS